MGASKIRIRICIFSSFLAFVGANGNATIQFSAKFGLSGEEAFTALTPLSEQEHGNFGLIVTASHKDSILGLLLKIVNDEGDSESQLLNEWNILVKLGGIANFREPAHKMSKARKAGIPYVYGYGEFTSGDYIGKKVIVMEKLGETLYNYIENLGEREVPVNVWTYLAYDIATSLEYIHSKNIIHRDVKAQNLLVDPQGTRDGGAIKWCLIDFGLAHDLVFPLKPGDAGGTVDYLSQHMLKLMDKETDIPQNKEDDLETSTIVLAFAKWKQFPWDVENAEETQKAVIDSLPKRILGFCNIGWPISIISIVYDTLSYARELPSTHTTKIKHKEKEFVLRWKPEISKLTDKGSKSKLSPGNILSGLCGSKKVSTS